MIYKETVKPVGSGSKGSIILAAAIVVFIVVIVGFCNYLYNQFGIPYISYIAFVLCVLLGIYVYRRKLREYRYCIIDDELIFEQIVGTKIKPIVNIKLSQIDYFCPLNSERNEGKKWDQIYLLLFKKKSSSAYVLGAKRGKKNIRIVFEPSDKMIEIIEKHKSAIE